MRYGHDHGHYPILALSRKLCYLLQIVRDAFSFEIIRYLPGSQIIPCFPLFLSSDAEFIFMQNSKSLYECF